jgi:CheY-like chemotaxis protein
MPTCADVFQGLFLLQVHPISVMEAQQRRHSWVSDCHIAPFRCRRREPMSADVGRRRRRGGHWPGPTIPRSQANDRERVTGEVLANPKSWAMTRPSPGTQRLLRRGWLHHRDRPDRLRGADAYPADLPNVVLLDIRMPDLDGVEVLRRIRAAHSAIPMIMITGNDDLAVGRSTLTMRAFDYVAKPFDSLPRPGGRHRLHVWSRAMIGSFPLDPHESGRLGPRPPTSSPSRRFLE